MDVAFIVVFTRHAWSNMLQNRILAQIMHDKSVFWWSPIEKLQSHKLIQPIEILICLQIDIAGHVWVIFTISLIPVLNRWCYSCL